MRKRENERKKKYLFRSKHIHLVKDFVSSSKLSRRDLQNEMRKKCKIKCLHRENVAKTNLYILSKWM